MTRTTKAVTIKAVRFTAEGLETIETFIPVPNFKEKTVDTAISKANNNKDGLVYNRATAKLVNLKTSMTDAYYFTNCKIEACEFATADEVTADEVTADETTADEVEGE